MALAYHSSWSLSFEFFNAGTGYGRTAGERGSCGPDRGPALEKAYYRQVPKPFYMFFPVLRIRIRIYFGRQDPDPH